MEGLSELENKVLLLIQKNKDFQSEISRLKQENLKLVEQNRALEMKHNNSVSDLSKERDEIKSSIESLLSSMEQLEKSSSKSA